MTDLSNNEAAWKELLQIVMAAKNSAAELNREVVTSPEPFVAQHDSTIEEAEAAQSRCATPDFQPGTTVEVPKKKKIDDDHISVDYDFDDDIPAMTRVEAIGVIVPSTPMGEHRIVEDAEEGEIFDDEVVAAPVAEKVADTIVDDTFSPTSSTLSSSSTSSKKTKREESEEDNVVVDLRTESDDDSDDNKQTVETTSKRRKIEVAAADEDSDDEEEAVRYIIYKKGEFAKVEDASFIKKINASLPSNNVKQIKSLTNVPNSVGTVFCIYDDAYVEAQAELLADYHLLNLAMEGRLRLTPRWSLVSAIETYGADQINLDALRHCSFDRRHEIVPIRSHIDTTNIIHPRWRMASRSVNFNFVTNPIIRNRNELENYLKAVLFTSK